MSFNENIGFWLKKQGLPSSLVRPFAKTQHRGHVLDLGCGGGRLAKSIESFCDKVTAVDKCAELIEHLQNNQNSRSTIDFVHGDIQLFSTWKELTYSYGEFDLIISNCAIRKDYCSLAFVTNLAKMFLKQGGRLILRIQGQEDLKDLLSEDLRSRLFYSGEEIRFYLGNCEVDSFMQKYSSPEYVRKSLKMINIDYDGPITKTNYYRHYYVANWERTYSDEEYARSYRREFL